MNDVNVIRKVFSERGQTHLVYKNFKFLPYRTVQTTGEQGWRCVTRKCQSKLFTLEDGTVFSRLEGSHNHEVIPEAKLNRKSITNAIKRKAVDDIDERPRKLILREIEEQGDAVDTLTRKDITYIRNNITHSRLQKLPKLPKSANEVHVALEEMEIKTVKNESFLMKNDKENGIIIFCCDTNLKTLCEKEIILMDGTFECSSKFFLQLFTIHGYTGGSYVPLVFCLLRDKKKQTYEEVLRIVEEECRRRMLCFQPKTVVIDFEQAIHQAVKSVFPQINVVGCRFHLAQAWWRKIQQLGLSAEYKDRESEEGRWLRYCFAMTYLRPEEVEDVFCFHLMPILPPDERFIQFADYLTETYLEEEALFRPSIWAEKSSALWRTTNACESFHSRFNDSFESSKPNIFHFVKNLRLFQTDTYVRINTKDAQKPDKKTSQKEEFVRKKINQMENGDIDVMNFLKCVSFKTCI